ncbi:MAG: hypothetical protein A4E63_02784 [Syntrophorhabdus sp. PtaU1.Bin050]|nr:MAG: hypothetical protein A4E63_02784 [Syntrophorhabdus sp. PtaU1.Bin050]
MKKRMFLLLTVLLFCISFLPLSVLATEGGNSHYPGTMEDFYAGLLPPEGVYLIDYMPIVQSNRLAGNNGKEADGVDFKMDGIFNAPRILFVTPWKIAGGNFCFHIFPSAGYLHVSVNGKSQSKTGIGDLDLGPAIKWHFKDFHMVAGLDLYMPTGAYDKDDLANIGLNYWTINPLMAFTYIGGKDAPLPGFEVSGKLDYMFNTVNAATGYKSGQQFGVNYLIGQHFGSWGVGINGQWMIQTTDDKIRNEPANFNGNRTSWFSVGGAVSYQLPKGSVTAKYVTDVSNKNCAKIDKILLKFVYPF